MSNDRWQYFGWPRAIVLAMAIGAMVVGTACDPPLDNSADSDASTDIADSDQLSASTALPGSGDVVVFGGWSKGNKSTASAEFFNPATKKFSKTGSMKVATGDGTGALLNSGEILTAGGFTGSSKFSDKKGVPRNSFTGDATNDLEIFNPATGKFTAASAPLLASRAGATATVLASGKVLIAGGADSSGTPTNTAEVFDPTAGTTNATANNMSSPRAFHSATLLGNNTVLIAGGATDNNGDITALADIYDPSTNQFTATTGPMSETRAAHAAVLLTTGTLAGDVLIVGGAVSEGSNIVYTDISAEVYDPVAGTFSFVGTMTDARAFHTATVLAGGQVLVAGGFNGYSVQILGGKLADLYGLNLNSAEIFDPVAETFTCINGTTSGGACKPAMKTGRAAHTATLFASGTLAGQVLIAGGIGSKKPDGTATELKEAELFNPTGSTFTATGSLNAPRGMDNAFLLP